MARTTITGKTLPGSYPSLQPAAGSLVVTEYAPGTASDGVQVALIPGKTILIARNANAGSQTITVTSVADQQGRTGDITTYSLAAGAIVALGPFQTEGWRQSDGNLYAVASHIDVKFSVLYLP
jgi:hypothetical protein